LHGCGASHVEQASLGGFAKITARCPSINAPRGRACLKDQYVGDIGDYVKLAFLRKISRHRKLGVLWYRTSDDPKKKDGRFIDYLCKPEQWRNLDADAFDHLHKIVHISRQRVIGALEDQHLLNGAVFWGVVVPCGPHFSRRPTEREEWFMSAV